MTLRLRLMLILGFSFTILWSAASVWTFLDVRDEFRDALDERLAASARMVAGLVSQLTDSSSVAQAQQAELGAVVTDGVACEVRFLRGGEVLMRTDDSPTGLGLVKPGFATRNIQGQDWRSYTLERDGKRVTTADRVGKRQALLRDIVIASVVPVLIATLGSLIVLWFGIRRGLAPLESVRLALANRKLDALQSLPAAEVPAELAPLVQTINSLLGRTQSAIARERRFTGDAAHELRTPLTVVKTHIQVARLTTGDETSAALENAEKGVRRLERTLEQLLTLAQVEGPFSFDGEENASPLAIAENALNEISADQRKRVVVEELGSTRRIGAPPVLAATALRNLLDNALRYSPPETPVKLRLSESGPYVCFSVLDEGPGMNEENRILARQPFWRQGTGQGSGLGLSIVDAIIKRFGGDFELIARAEGGMMATIKLPAA